jgi:mono/diheme cytochrome c family protein
MRTLTLACVTAVLSGCYPPEANRPGRALFEDYCVACHGSTGRGDGPAAAGLPSQPADLTRISDRNGGVFPMARIMSVIDGFTRSRHGGQVMPEFGEILGDGEMVLTDTGDGIQTPAPAGLVALADYLRSIQE